MMLQTTHNVMCETCEFDGETGKADLHYGSSNYCERHADIEVFNLLIAARRYLDDQNTANRHDLRRAIACMSPRRFWMPLKFVVNCHDCSFVDYSDCADKFPIQCPFCRSANIAYAENISR